MRRVNETPVALDLFFLTIQLPFANVFLRTAS
jgi:hypothetical protein